MERGMQFPPYLYELFKRVKSIVVPEFLLYDFFFMSNLVLYQVRLQTQPLPVPGQPLYFLILCPLSVGSVFYQFKSYCIFPCPISGSVADPALTGTYRATTLFSKIVPNFCRLGIISIQKLLCFSLFNFRFGCRPNPYRQLEKNLCILVPWIVSKKQSPKKAQKDFTKVKKG